MEKENITVLVVDDDADYRQLMVFWLKSKGYTVLTAENGQQACQEVQNKKPDIVFMDLRMPVMDGIGAIKNIRRFNKNIPIIIISAYPEEPKIKEAVPFGISGVFYKGKDFEEGLTVLESALRTHKGLKK